MSASLVGSEMCIRDSRTAPRAPGSAAGKSPTFAYSELRRGLFGPLGMLGPVSYTHLTLPTICSV
eukprot:6058623-Alexandrium_andersonii.AAC.1